MDELDAQARDARLVEEATRLLHRYAVEFLEPHGFCPYARRARLEGRTRVHVILERDPSPERLLVATRALAPDLGVDVAFLVLPRYSGDAAQLGHLVEATRRAHQDEPAGLVMTMEGFHPGAPFDTSSKEAFVRTTRRTPDPTVQLTRLELLEAVRRAAGDVERVFFDPATMSIEAWLAAPPRCPLHELIHGANLATGRAHEADLLRVLEDLERDRAMTYAALGEVARS